MCRQISNAVLPMVPQEEGGEGGSGAQPAVAEPGVTVDRISRSMFLGPKQTVGVGVGGCAA